LPFRFSARSPSLAPPQVRPPRTSRGTPTERSITAFGHTGAIRGYTSLIAATRSAHRSVTLSINIGAPPSLYPALKKVERRAVCAALAGR